MDEMLYRMVQDSTVRVVTRDPAGTGCFVAPGFVLTCNYVVTKDNPSRVRVIWRDAEYVGRISAMSQSDDGNELALLQIQDHPSTHQCVYLHDSIRPGDILYSFGFPANFRGGDSSRFECEGLSIGPTSIKFKGGQVAPGLGGAPLLNERTVSDTSGGRSPFDHYFSDIPPYYLVARCDLTTLRRWTLSTCKSLGFDFSQFSSPYEFNEDSNAFVQMAESKEFRHDINVYQLSPIATHSSRNLHWLARNRHCRDSRTNLFYILTSLLVPLEEAHRFGPKLPDAENKDESRPPKFGSTAELEVQVAHQSWGDRKRLSIELNCPPGNPRPEELFDLVVYLTEVQPDDFDTSAPMFGRQEFLVRPAAESVKRYLRSRSTIESRLRECYERGLVRGATW